MERVWIAFADNGNIRKWQSTSFDGAAEYRLATALEATASPVVTAPPARGQVEPLLQEVGDAIAGVFDQMLKGKWRDDHDHDVRFNAQMLKLKDALGAIGKFRENHLGYSPFTSPAEPAPVGEDQP